MFKVIKRSRSMRDVWGGRAGRNAGDDVAHGPDAPSSVEPASVSGPALHDGGGALGIQNAGHSPDRFPDGRNLYLDRPLPPPPPPKSTPSIVLPPVMPTARPSTSGGTGPSAKASVILGLSEKPAFNSKRISRDDMYVPSQMGSYRKAMQPYRVGVRGLPTPEASPGSSPPMPQPTVMPPRMPTPESVRSGEIQIGMALGSPSHAPDSYSGWQPQEVASFQPPRQATQQATTQQARALALASLDPVQPTTPPTVQRQKTQRRKLFGLFGSKKNSEAKASEASSLSSSPTIVVVSNSIEAQYPFGETTPIRSNTVADRKTARHQPIIIRSNTEPAVQTPVEAPRTYRSYKATSPNPSFNSSLEPNNSGPSVGSIPSITTTTTTTTSTTTSSTGGPFLDVEIPSIKMERYSVMFDSLLNPQGSSSLLARRQATLEKLKSINDKIVQEEEQRQKLRQRRATSPQPTKSPAFTLFPPTERHQTSSPLTPRRSNTSPAHLPSPSQLNFDRNHHHGRRERKTVTIVSPREADQRSPPAAAPHEQEVIHPGPESDFHFGPEESGLVLDSPQSMGEHDHPISDFGDPNEVVPHAVPMRPTVQEPQWQMFSPPASSAGSSVMTGTTRRSPTSSASSVHTHITRPSVDTNDGVGDNALKTAVEISIARQISISRQQRTLLRPMKTAVATAPAAPSSRPRLAQIPAASAGAQVRAAAGASPIRKGALGQNERVAATRYATPTVVVPTETMHSQLAQHRKSERVVVEAI